MTDREIEQVVLSLPLADAMMERARSIPTRSALAEFIEDHADERVRSMSDADRVRLAEMVDFLIEHGFIHKLESINAYTSCHHPAEQHSVPFFICDRCGSATEFCDSHVADLLVGHAAALGFTAHAQTLEVHGVCAQCAGALA